jgi:hypothetical protein
VEGNKLSFDDASSLAFDDISDDEIAFATITATNDEENQNTPPDDSQTPSLAHPPSSLTVETFLQSKDDSKKHQKRKSGNDKNEIAEIVKQRCTILEMIKEKEVTAAAAAAAEAPKSREEQAIDLFSSMYSTNLDPSMSLKIKVKLCDDEAAILFLLSHHEKRELYLANIIS